jgi:VWFA-related protein
MKTRRAIQLLSMLATIPLSIGAAQVTSARSLAKDTHAVTITFFVDDNRGNPVSTLRFSDFSVLDNKKPPVRLVSLGAAKELPLRLGILIDNNPGVRYFKKQLVEYESPPNWAVDFVDEMLTRPDDKAFIASYSTIRHGTTFASRDQLQPIDLNQFLKTDAPDFLGSRDAIRVACKEVFGADPAGRERRILIVAPEFSQVGRSLSDYAQVISAAQRAGVKVFISGWLASQASMRSLGMQALVSETGGYEFGGWLEDARSQIDSMYSLTYIPAEPYQPGKFRRLDLKATNKSWHVHAQKRYLTPSTQ